MTVTAAVHSEASPTPLLDVCDLHVSYAGAVRALQGISVAVPARSIVAVLGANGAGKSTLLKAISGTLQLEGGAIDAGSITFDGQRLKTADPAAIVRAGIVQVPEGRRIFGELTVDENLRAAGLAARDRLTRAASRERVYDLFPLLLERRGQRAALLSGGEQQMLAIGRALMTKPRLLLLDEPSLGLAPRLVHQIAEIVQEINRQGTAVLIVEQNAAMALEIADSGFVLEVGRVALQGPASELEESDEVRQRYLGIVQSQGEQARADSRDTRSPAREQRQLRLEGVTVRFGGVSALSEVSFTIEPGSIHAVIGPNGAGKSTCLNVVTGVYGVAAGTVGFGDVELTRRRPYQIARLGISRTFQNISLSSTATVGDNLMLGRHRLSHWGFVSNGFQLPWAVRERRTQEERVRAIAELLELDDKLDVPVGVLAYGDRKRVEVGRALCAEPSLLLLDEPVAGMNSGESQQMARTIGEIREALGITIVLVEHDMAFVMGLADRVTVLDFGRVISEGTPEQVQRDPEVLRAYLGRKEDSALALDTIELLEEGPS